MHCKLSMGANVRVGMVSSAALMTKMATGSDDEDALRGYMPEHGERYASCLESAAQYT